MRLTARSEYGLLAMIDLACSSGDDPVSAREISERQSIPAKFLEQLLVDLRRAELVTAVRGAKGGFRLTKSADEVTVLEIVEALEGPVTSTVCDGDRSANCGKSHACAASRVWESVTEAVKSVFDSTTLGELARKQVDMDNVDKDMSLC